MAKQYRDYLDNVLLKSFLLQRPTYEGYYRIAILRRRCLCITIKKSRSDYEIVFITLNNYFSSELIRIEKFPLKLLLKQGSPPREHTPAKRHKL